MHPSCPSSASCFPVKIGGRLRQTNALRVDEFADAVEGKRRLRRDDAVDEDLTSLQFADAALLLRVVPRPDAGAESERRAVGEIDGLVEIARAKQHRHGTE